MNATTPRPAALVKPGRVLLRELRARGWSQKDLAAKLGRSTQLVCEIVNGKKAITARTAIQLARVFGTTPEYWWELQTRYELDCALQEVSA